MSDAFYTSLEEKFRGDKSEIKRRLRVYLPFILPIAKLSPDAPILDLGCGRGEWLELMREQKLVATGIDINALSVKSCQSVGLNAIHADAMAVLGEMAENSVAVITGFHIAEHLAFDALLELCSKAMRALIPGGLLILETPNPENIIVGSHTFYLDPSHKHPLPPLLLDHVFDHIGFPTRKTLRLQEPSEPEYSDTLQDRLQSVSPDYALIGQKPGSKVHLENLVDAFSTDVGSPPQESQLAAPLMPTEIFEDIRTSLMGSHAAKFQAEGGAGNDTWVHKFSLPDTLNQLSQNILIEHANQRAALAKTQQNSDSKLDTTLQKLIDIEQTVAKLSKTQRKQGQTIQSLTGLTDQVKTFVTISQTQQHAIDQQQSALVEKSETIVHQKNTLKTLENMLVQMNQEREEAQHILSSTTIENESLKAQFEALKNERDATVTSLHAIAKSTSWRITKPLRFLSVLLRSPRKAAYSLIRNMDHTLKRVPRFRLMSIRLAKRLGVTREQVTKAAETEQTSVIQNQASINPPWAVRPPNKRTGQWLKILGAE